MAQTLLGKIGILVSATLHGLLDQALRANSLGVFDEYIRQAENSMRLLEDALVDLKATVKGLAGKYDRAADDAARFDLEIDKLLKAGKDSLAKATMLRMNSALDIAKSYKDQYDRQKSTVDTLVEVVQVLQAKVDVLKSQREQVATLLQLIKTKNIASKSIREIEKISDTQTTAILDDVRSKLDVADARLEVATERLSSEIDSEIGDATLEAQLEQRRARLGLT
jgi:phage shock protein A